MGILENRQTEMIKEINQKIDDLNSNIEKEVERSTFDIENFRRLSKKLESLKEEKRILNISKKINHLNKEYKAKRSLLSDFLKITLPTEDITNSDTTIHKTRIKKYPELKNFLEKYDIKTLDFSHKAQKYTSFFSREIGCSFDIIENGKYAEKENVYLNFEGLLSRNDIRVKNITLKQFLSLESKLLKEREKIENIISKYEKSLNDLNFHKLQSERLISQLSRVSIAIPSKMYL